jgi:glutathione synthase/RimK-type ligase-like ATP-grasp enzyme
VYLCREPRQVAEAVASIFDPHSKSYDYVALAQPWISDAIEYRAIWFNEEIPLLYRKDVTRARFAGNLSPLHWENARAVPVDDLSRIRVFLNFLQPLPDILDLGLAGLDVLEDRDGRLWLLEINSQPDFALFIRDNGDERIVALYRKFLGDLPRVR